MKEKIEGVVIKVDADIAKVRISRHSECSNCGACPGDNALILDVIDPFGTKPGQHVLLETKERNMLKAVFFVYVLPLVAVSAGIYLGYFLSAIFKINHLLPMTTGGFVLGLIAILVIKQLDVALADDMPKIAKVIK